MAALLIEIKSRMLLPRPRREDDGEPEDPRAELVRRLLEYERMKQAAHALGEVPVAGRDFSVVEVYIEQALAERLPDVQVADLSEAWRSILARARMTRHHRITREQLSVRAHMSRILRRSPPGAFVEFSELFEPEHGRAGAGRELPRAARARARIARSRSRQQSPFDPIYVKLKAERATLTIA